MFKTTLKLKPMNQYATKYYNFPLSNTDLRHLTFKYGRP